jgi:hypothetical protein
MGPDGASNQERLCWPGLSSIYWTGVGLFADDTCIYATDRKEDYVLRKLQRGLSTIKTWCERRNIKINTTHAIYFSHGLSLPEIILY